MLFNENAIKNKIQTYKNKIWSFFDGLMTTEKEKRHEEHLLDHELKESFPASDPPAHRAKSMEDTQHITH